MKLNERSVAHYATCDSPPDKTGFLFKKGERNTAFHRRWFVLKGNMLFYFEERESREPVGVIVLEGCTVELCESPEEFAFAVRFDCARARVYKMAAESQAGMESWVKALSRASFDYMRLVVRELERQLEEMQEAAGGVGSLQGRGKGPRRLGSRRSKASHHPPEVQPRDNGVSWSKPAATPPNGSDTPPAPIPWDEGGEGSSDGVRPPPVPPRRRSGLGGSTSSLESPVSPDTVCFSKLHSWYGREVALLREEWQQSQ
ncbi:sesquipedalian-1 [Conger conger]|nr:sesquipedalian-1 [Conger conger]XP_061116300.1 sesquipedalian-1 [Conger conger]